MKEDLLSLKRIFSCLNIISFLLLEDLALRQQLAILKRTSKKPHLKRGDRLFWVCLSKIWKGWKQSLIIVSPDTVVKWHRMGFKLFWRIKSRPKENQAGRG